jgi:hypothetical protein
MERSRRLRVRNWGVNRTLAEGSSVAWLFVFHTAKSLLDIPMLQNTSTVGNAGASVKQCQRYTARPMSPVQREYRPRPS